MSALAACPAPTCHARLPRARARTLRRRALGVIGMVLLLAGQSAATCHEPHLKARQDATLRALTAASLCSNGAASATASSRVPAPADAPAPSAPSPTDLGSAGVGCLHCAGSGCNAIAGGRAAGRPVTAPAVTAAVAPTGGWDKSGAWGWRNGHPVRGPPSALV